MRTGRSLAGLTVIALMSALAATHTDATGAVRDSPAPPGGVYGGRSTQGHPMSVRVTADGRRLRDAFFRLDAGHCSTSATTQYTLALHLHSGPSVTLRRDGSFSDTRPVDSTTPDGNTTHFDVVLRGRVSKRRATGMMRVSGPVRDPEGNVVDRCDSGAVRWALARGSGYAGASDDGGALSIRLDHDGKRLRSFFIDFRIACGSLTFRYSFEHEGIKVRRDGRFSKRGLSGLGLVGPENSSASGRYRLRGELRGRRASGTYTAVATVRLSDGTSMTCQTGAVHWTAMRH
jgi:hypothetical protein